MKTNRSKSKDTKNQPDPAAVILPTQVSWFKQSSGLTLPRSEQYADDYLLQSTAIDATNSIFLEGNHLKSRWQQLAQGDHFCIGETGFGSGINLLAAAKLWQKTAHDGAHLDYVSTELHPMPLKDMAKTHAIFPELRLLSKTLLAAYPPAISGVQRFELLHNLTVTLVFDNASNGLDLLCSGPSAHHKNHWQIDAWFFDGFNPCNNPDMWSNKLFANARQLSNAGTTFVSSRCSNLIKDHLASNHFTCNSQEQSSNTLIGLLTTPSSKPTSFNNNNSDIKNHVTFRTHASRQRWHLASPEHSKPIKTVAIIGSGIAGATTAKALSARGIQCTVLDKDGIAGGASSNPQAALYTKLASAPSTANSFSIAALSYAQRFYQSLLNTDGNAHLGDMCGLAVLAQHHKHQQELKKQSDQFLHSSDFVLFKSAEELSALSNVNLSEAGLWYKNSGWLDSKAVCQALLKQSKAELIPQCEVAKIIPSKQGQPLQLQSNNPNVNSRTFDAVILCAGMQSLLQPCHWLPLKPIAGQVNRVNATDTNFNQLSAVLCKKSYLTPANKGLNSFGADYQLNQPSAVINKKSSDINWLNLKQMLPNGELFNQTQRPANISNHWAGVRCTTPDYLPITGPVPKVDAFQHTYQSWADDRTLFVDAPCPVEPGIFVNTGFGSRGFCYAPLVAEHLSSCITKSVSPLSVNCQQAINPARFLVRNIIRTHKKPATTA